VPEKTVCLKTRVIIPKQREFDKTFQQGPQKTGLEFIAHSLFTIYENSGLPPNYARKSPNYGLSIR
jgi:hypothetical protein